MVLPVGIVLQVLLRQERSLRGEAGGVTHKEAAVANVGASGKEHDKTLETNTTTTMGLSTVAESINVELQRLDRDILGSDSLGEHLGVVHALSTGHDLLSAKHEIIGVRVVRVCGIRHGVERAHRHGELVKEVPVDAVLLLHESTKALLDRGGEIIKIRSLVGANAVLAEESNSLCKGEHESVTLCTSSLNLSLELLRRTVHDGVAGEVVADGLKLNLVLLVEAVKNVEEHVGEHVENLMVVLLEAHLNVEAVELTKVACGVTVLCAEDRANFEDTLEATASCKDLLVKLRGLCKTAVVAEVLGLKNLTATLRAATKELRGLDLDETLVVKELTEVLADSRGNAHDSLLERGAQRQVAVVKLEFLANDNETSFTLAGSLLDLGELVGGAVSIDNLERELKSSTVHNEERLDLELDSTLRARGWLRRLDEHAADINDGLSRKARAPLGHLSISHHALHGCHMLAKDHERHLGLCANSVHVASAEHLSAGKILSELVHGGPLFTLAVLIAGLRKRKVTEGLSEHTGSELGVLLLLLGKSGSLALETALLLLASTLVLGLTSVLLGLLLVLTTLGGGKLRRDFGLEREKLANGLSI